jgi:Flp pilus assembly protein CpaB
MASPLVAERIAVRVVVAARFLGRFIKLTKDDVKEEDMPEDLVPEGAISKVEEVLDRWVVWPIPRGEPILDNRISDQPPRLIDEQRDHQGGGKGTQLQ